MNSLTNVDSNPKFKLPEGVTVMSGWNEWVMNGLVSRSREPEMQKWVPRDFSERFADFESAKKWGNRDEHIVYSLVIDEELAGIVWFTRYDEPKYENADFTFAIRMYEKSRGKGLSSLFAGTAIADLEKSHGYTGKIWLETDTDNEIALKLYSRLGFERVSEHGKRVVLIRP